MAATLTRATAPRPCLSSVAGIADEIIIIDTGLEDGPKEIAGKFTSWVVDFTWIDDFAAARNYSS